MTSRAVDEEGNFSKTKIRNLDDRKLGPVEVERIREMWEMRCNRALRKAGFSERRNPPLATSPGHQTTSNSAPGPEGDRYVPATATGHARRKPTWKS
jgi:hypothetical protein